MPEEKERSLRGPVGWLLDRQLMVNLREILLYSAFGTRIDPRNWMVGREINLAEGFEGEEFWFDYLSDTGDSMRATYSMAYLAYSDLWTTAREAPGPAAFEPGGDASRRLPRGAFLVVGGDTAYHVADYETLADRFQFPFKRAFKHLGKRVDRRRRPLFGIPGNHDYYDFLDGFNRQFRRPYNAERSYRPDEGGDQPQLVIDGFRRRQWASYFSLKLPFGWRFLGMDAQGGSMDRRQKNFFRSLLQLGESEKPAERLIVATPEPITAFGRRASPEAEISRTLEDIGLPRPFLKDDPGEALPPGSCRLDLAGDVHHYTRYWGSEPGAARPARYASVVSGLGGAFLHSTSTDAGEVRARSKYPDPTKALAETLRRVLQPWSIFLGGRVWQIGLLVAGLLYIGASSASSLRSVLKPAMDKAGFILPGLPSSGGLMVEALRTLQGSLAVESLESKERFHWELAYIPLLLLLVGFATYRNGRLSARRRHGETVPDSAWRWPVWLLASAGLASIVWVYGRPDSAYEVLHPLTANLAVLTMLGVSFLGLWWCRQYDDAMNFKVRRTGSLTVMDQALGWILWTFTLLAGLFGLTRYGFYPLSVAAIDIAFLVVVLGILIGLPAFACVVGGQLHRWPGRIGFLLLGLAHAILQIAVPVILVVSSSPLIGWSAAAATVVFTWGVGRLVPCLLRDAERRYLLGVLLLLLWLGWSAGLLALAIAAPEPQHVKAASFFLALGLGAIFSCTWFGWYLAVSLCFDGHNNEAGGGARIEQCKQLIRFRLTRDALTGFVIVIDEPKADGRELKPRVFDVFEIRPG